MSSHSHHTTLHDGTQVASWDASTVCAQCCDGVSSCVPLEPHPLGVEAPSGLSRVAQLSAAHAVGVPFIPSYCHEQGGVVLDRVAFNRGDKVNWHSTALRLHMSSLLDKSKRPQHPQGLLGLSFRARTAGNKTAASQGVTARRPPLTVNVSSDIHRLDHLGFLSRTNFTAAHIPSTTVALRQDMHAGNTIRMGAHVNRPFATSSGWEWVPMVATADWTAAPQGSPFTVRLGCEHVSSAPDPSSWGFSTLEHAACLHGAALVTLCASSRPQRTSGTAVADSASDSVTLDGLRREQPPSDLAGVTLKLPDGTVKDLGRHKRHISIVQRQGAGAGGAASSQSRVSASRPPDELAAPLQTSANSPVVSQVQSQQPAAVPVCPAAEQLASCSGRQVAASAAPPMATPPDLQRTVAEAKEALLDATYALQRTTSAQLMAGLQKQMEDLREVQGQMRSAGAAVQHGKLRKALKSHRGAGWLSRRSLPWLWNAAPGVSAAVQLGAVVRTPLHPDALWSMLGRQGAAVSATSEDTSLRADAGGQGRGFRGLWGRLCEPIMPMVRPSRVQPVMRARLEGTMGKFRRAVLDHTSAVLEVETCCRGSGAASIGPALLTGRKPAGMFHAVSLSARQQVLGPVRAFADVRWEVWPARAAAAAATAAPTAPATACASPAWAHSVRQRCRGLQTERSGCNVGVDLCLGFARASAWYSVSKRQGMVELRV